jgi:hypothetical protein
LIKKMMLAMAAAALLVATALPAFAQLEFLSPDATASAANEAAQEQTANQEQNCINILSQENNQTANVEQNNVFGDNTSTVNQDAANVAIGNELQNKCEAVIVQEQDLEQQARAAAAAALGEAVAAGLGDEE